MTHTENLDLARNRNIAGIYEFAWSRNIQPTPNLLTSFLNLNQTYNMKITAFDITNHNMVLYKNPFRAYDVLDIIQEMGHMIQTFLSSGVKNSRGWGETERTQFNYIVEQTKKIDELYDDSDECQPLPGKQRETWALIETLRQILSDLAGENYEFDYQDGDLYKWSYHIRGEQSPPMTPPV